jgi:phage shock protein A
MNMTETLVVRVKRIISGNISDMVDRLEKSQAEIVMKEAMREVDRAVEDLRNAQGRALAQSKQAERQIEAYSAKRADLDEKVDFALGQDREDLAKAAIAKQVDLEAQIKVLTEAKADAEAEHNKLADYVVALMARKRDMETELKAIMMAKADAAAAMPGNDKTSPMGRADTASEVFKRAMDAASNLSAPANTNPTDAAKLSELEAMSHADKIEQRLNAAKQRRAAA